MRTILLVDDNESLIELFTLFFQEAGWAVLTAPGGRECLEVLGHERPDLILLDIMMVPMDGWETLHQIKENPLWANIPVAMLTGKALSQKEFDSFSMLFEHYMVKPLHENEMVLLSGQVVDEYNKVQREAKTARNKGIDSVIIEEYLNVNHRVLLNKRMSASPALQGFSIPWDPVKDQERLRELEKIFREKGVNISIAEQGY